MRRLLLAIALCFFLASPSAFASVFSDVASNHPNFDAITYLYENGIVEGYGDNTFRPDQAVNRAEALKILLLGSDVFVPEIQPQEIFPDVLHDTWYGKYVLKAKNLTIVKGDDGTGMFRPGDTVNLAEALKMLLKTNDIDSPAPASNPYWDVSKDAWFGSYFEYARLAGLLDQSSGENVYPATPVTRGMLAELMYRLATNDFIMADGKASYYGEKFHGKTTASGEIFDASAFTAAHLTYSFGTRLKVTSVETGKSVVVRVNDRGPYVSDPNRIIDLSKAAFEYIAPLSRGIIEVKIEVTQDPVTESSSSLTDLLKSDILNTSKVYCPDADSLKYIEKNAFEKITLDETIPTRMILDDVLTLRGTTSVNTSTVSAFLVDSDDNQTAFYGDVKSGRFTLSVRFPKEGDFRLGILPGESGTSNIRQIKVLKNTCIEEVQSTSMAAVAGFELDYQEGNTVMRWDQGNYNLFKLTFSQGGLHKSYILHDLTQWSPVYKEFTTFQAGNVDLSLRGAALTKSSLLEPVQIVWSPAAEKTFLASDHYEYQLNEDEIELVSLTENAILKNDIQAVLRPKVDIRSKAAVILPSGKVHEIEIASGSATPHENAVGIDVFSAGNYSLTARYTTEKTGLHFIEVNNAEGLAVLNAPIYVRNQYPLLPSPRDLSSGQPEDLGDNLSDLKLQFLSLVNRDRNEHQMAPLKIDDSLNSLAQARSDDMVRSGYFSHWDKQGRTVNDLRANYGIQTQIGENLAKDTNLTLAEYGLMRSAIHRSNILSEEWTRVGFGITKDSDGSYIVVQLFSTDPLDLSDLAGLRSTLLENINDGRSSALTLKDNLNTLAQAWSQKMADEDFFDFTDGSGASLVDTIRDAGVNVSLGTYIMGNSSFSDAIAQAGENAQLKDSKWKDIGIGIEQDNLGIIKITLIYTE
ncbi:septal ring lytic transglycosylase RlpA family protein [Candidatus Peregrinibacteria bacterium]|nr:septal ring lytic transglycosylase RlpA family protein [Candidatus Peregrinibacteria bacterium]